MSDVPDVKELLGRYLPSGCFTPPLGSTFPKQRCPSCKPTLRCGGQDVPSANVLSRGSEAAVDSSDVSDVDADWLMSSRCGR